jgi:hypothetical protein
MHKARPDQKLACSVTNKNWISNAIAGLALTVSFWNAWQNWVIQQYQRQETAVAKARQVTVTLRRFDPDVDPFDWGMLGDRESMKDKLVTVHVFNDGDAEVQDVVIELLVVKHGAWTLLGQRKIDRLAAHTESPVVVGGEAFYDPLPPTKGHVTFTDEHGSRWVRWSDGRLLNEPNSSISERSHS